MKNIIRILFVLVLVSFSVCSHAQAPPPPPENAQTGGGGSTGPVGGGGAPIDGSLTIFLAMIAAYGGWKLYVAMKEKNKTDHPARVN